MMVFGISYKEKGQLKAKPHVLLIMAEDYKTAIKIGREHVIADDGDLRTIKWAGTSIPLLVREGDVYICYKGSVDEGG